MDIPTSTSHSFVVKVWIEEVSRETGQSFWRGHITHVQSGVRRYIEDLVEIELFMQPYLNDLNVKLTVETRLWWWLSALRMSVLRWIKRRRRMALTIGLDARCEETVDEDDTVGKKNE